MFILSIEDILFLKQVIIFNLLPFISHGGHRHLTANKWIVIGPTFLYYGLLHNTRALLVVVEVQHCTLLVELLKVIIRHLLSSMVQHHIVLLIHNITVSIGSIIRRMMHGGVVEAVSMVWGKSLEMTRGLLQVLSCGFLTGGTHWLVYMVSWRSLGLLLSWHFLKLLY